MTDFTRTLRGDEGSCLSSMEKDVVEISLLLGEGDAVRLERVAHARGVTAGVMVRQMLHDFLIRNAPRCPE